MLEQAQIPRRDLLKGLAITTAGLATYGISKATQNFTEMPVITEQSSSRLEQILSYERLFLNPLPDNLTGTLINIPFAPYDSNPNLIHTFVNAMNVLDSHTARTFIIDNSFPQVGTYDMRYLANLRGFIAEANAISPQKISFGMPFMDMFNFSHSSNFNPIYGSTSLRHAFLRNASKPYDIEKRHREFFTDKKTINEFKNHIQLVMDYLEPVSEFISFWEVANEPVITFNTEDKKAVMTEWLSQVLPAITDKDPYTPISAGTKDAREYNGAELSKLGLNLASYHIYGGNWSFEQQSLYQYMKEMKQDTNLPPVFLGEMGFPKSIFGMKLPEEIYDTQLARAISDNVLNNCYIDDDAHKVVLPKSNLALWQLLMNQKSRDGFQIDPNSNPQAVKAINMVQALYNS